MSIFLTLFLVLFFSEGFFFSRIFLKKNAKTIWNFAIALLFTILQIASHVLLMRCMVPRPVLLLLPCITNTALLFLVFLPLLVLSELVRIAFYRKSLSFYDKQKIFIIILASCSFLIGIHAEYSALRFPDIKHVEIETNLLPEHWNECDIVFLTDLHFCRITSPDFSEKIVELVNQENPDIILLGGDYVDGSKEYWEKSLLHLKNLRSKNGIFAVPGNHEYFNGYDEIMNSLRQNGITVLENRNVVLERGGQHVAIAGLTSSSHSKGSRQIEKIMNGIPNNIPTIILEHRPLNARENSKYANVILQLSGHTHGGMISILNKLFIAPANDGFCSGLYQLGKMKLYVSNGTSLWNGCVLRLGVPPEITKITLKKQKDESAGSVQ